MHIHTQGWTLPQPPTGDVILSCYARLHTRTPLYYRLDYMDRSHAHGCIQTTTSYRPQAPAAQLPPASLKSPNPAILGPRRCIPTEPPSLYPELDC